MFSSFSDMFFNKYLICIFLFQYDHYFETTHKASFGNDPKPVPKDLLHLPGKRLKEYYEIVDEARPLSGLSPTHAGFFTEMHFYSWN